MARTKKAKVAETVRASRSELLVRWQDLNDHILELTEDEALALIKEEKAGKRRSGFLTRLHGRYNVLRRQREIEELLQR